MAEPKTPDMTLWRDIKRDAGPGDAPQAPTVNIFRNPDSGKTLYDINARHGDDENNATHQNIRTAIEKFKPDLVIIEASVHDMPRFIAEAQKRTDRPEPMYAALIANQNGIEVKGGEPPAGDFMTAMKVKSNGVYSGKDVMALDMLKWVNQSMHDGTLSKDGSFAETPENLKKFETAASWYLQKRNSGLPPDTKPEDRLTTPAQFMEWYDSHKSELGNKSVFNVTTEDFAPYDDAQSTYFQKMNSLNGKVRDEYTAIEIGKEFADHDRILVVYGEGHFRSLEPVFKKMMGSENKPVQFEKPGAATTHSPVDVPESQLQTPSTTPTLAVPVPEQSQSAWRSGR